MADKIPMGAPANAKPLKGNFDHYTLRLYTYCKGDPEEKKYDMLNTALILYSQSKIKKPYRGKPITTITEFCEAQYQPNVNSKDFHMLFAKFSKVGIRYRLTTDFNGFGKLLSNSVLLFC